MVRKTRLDYDGALHHVIGRGVNGRPVFLCDEDRRNFLHRIADILEGSSSSILAWSLLPNHFHMLYRTGSIPLSKFMQRLLTGYSVSFNKKYDRKGHLFQNRHLARLVEESAYMYRLIAYIHLNPLRAGVVDRIEELEEYPWSGHCSVLRSTPHSWHDVDALLGWFGSRIDRQLENYRTHMLRAYNRSDIGADDAGFLWEFPYRNAEDELQSGQAHSSRLSLEKLFDSTKRTVGQHYETTFDRPHSKGRTPGKLAKARAALTFLMAQHGMSLAELARRLGISRQAASKALRKGKSLVQKNANLGRLLPDANRETAQEQSPENS